MQCSTFSAFCFHELRSVALFVKESNPKAALEPGNNPHIPQAETSSTFRRAANNGSAIGLLAARGPAGPRATTRGCMHTGEACSPARTGDRDGMGENAIVATTVDRSCRATATHAAEGSRAMTSLFSLSMASLWLQVSRPSSWPYRANFAWLSS